MELNQIPNIPKDKRRREDGTESDSDTNVAKAAKQPTMDNDDVIDEVEGSATASAAVDASTAHHDAQASTKEIEPKQISAGNVPMFKKLSKLKKSICKAQYHHKMMTDALLSKKPPKGLNPKRITLRLTDLSVDTQLRWERAHIVLATTLTDILRDHWKARAENLTETFNGLHGDLTTDDDTEIQYIDNLLKHYEEEAIKEIKEARNKNRE